MIMILAVASTAWLLNITLSVLLGLCNERRRGSRGRGHIVVSASGSDGRGR